MKKIILGVFFVMCLMLQANAQVGIGTTTPNPGAMLDVSSTANGTTFGALRLPVVTIAERDLIDVSTDPRGLIVYVYDAANFVDCLQFYTGSFWTCIESDKNSQKVIGYQYFDGAVNAIELSYTATGGGQQGGQAITPSDNKFVSANFGYASENESTVIDFDPINTSGSSGAYLKFRLAAMSDALLNRGLFEGDYVRVSISADGITYSNEIEIYGEGSGFLGSNGARWDFDATAEVIVSYDGDNEPSVFRASENSVFEGFATVLLTGGLSNSATTHIRIEMYSDYSNGLASPGGSGIWIIDNVEVFGD